MLLIATKLDFLINPFHPSAASHIETIICFAQQQKMTSFYMKRNTGPKWVKVLQKSNPKSKCIL